MCGIVGYLGDKPSEYIILNGLKKLEYRGYDSSGLSILTNNGDILTEKEIGKIVNLENLIFKNDISQYHSKCGIGHTRWATHGEPSKENAHPHTDCTNSISVVHNGIIENYSSLKDDLINKGHKFLSKTDTEVIPHILEDFIKEEKDILKALDRTLSHLKGAFALGILIKNSNPSLIGVKKGSPLILGIGEGEFFLASDVTAFLDYTNRVIFLQENDIVLVDKSGYSIFNNCKKIIRKEEVIRWNSSQAQKGGFKHYMLKEIFEQPEALYNSIIDKVNFEEKSIIFDEFDTEFKNFLKEDIKIVISACGTSWHSSLIGKFLIESMSSIPVEVDYSSEFRYRNRKLSKKTLIIAVSQSGETADTLEAIKRYKGDNKILSICNVVGSSIPRESDFTIYTHAGPEISVASTKAFTTQVIIFYTLANYIGRLRDEITEEIWVDNIETLKNFSKLVQDTLKTNSYINKISPELAKYSDFLYIGRGINYPVALEGALKLKEISYIHAEGYPAGEMKHGPLALIDENFPSVVLLPKDRLYEKMIANLNEIRSRRGKTIIVTDEDNIEELNNYSEIIIKIPSINEFLQPILITIALQLLSYHIADFKGCDIDQPRNLAKSVTVE